MQQAGLTSDEANKYLEKFGPNDVEENKKGVVKKFLLPLVSPISLMLLVAAILSYIGGRILDFWFILSLYLVNYGVQKWQEFKADKAVEHLRSKLSFDVWTLRDGRWIFVAATKLVPGDYIRLGLGSMIPADAEIITCKNLSVNEAVLSGESMPKTKKIGDKIFSGSFISTGNLQAKVTATGKKTFFGKTIFSIEQPRTKSILEKDIFTIARFLTITALVSVIVLSLYFLLLKNTSWGDLLTLDLSLVIAGIPIALPAVMAVILSIGASGLASKQVIVRRLSALQDLANVNLLLTDKTGTLTKNEIKVVDIVSYKNNVSTDQAIEIAGYAVPREAPDAIDMSILKKLQDMQKIKGIDDLEGVKILNAIPYDSDRKRSTAFVEKNGKRFLISLGAPQIIEGLVKFTIDEKEKFKTDIKKAAESGYRTLAFAIKYDDEEEKDMNMLGVLFLADPLDETSKSTLEFMQDNGISVKMVTGDNVIITKRIVKELGLSGEVLSREDVNNFYKSGVKTGKEFDNIAAFAEILPKDKYELVQASKGYFVVASTGDGINDLPALKVANVGIAVSRAVTALKSLADIVLLGQGLSVIKDGILESRKIFSRLYVYSIYRISESFRLIITILILGLAVSSYPLEPLQIILLAFLNDVPIISLAFNRVKLSRRPSHIQTKRRFILALLFGLVGILQSLVLFFMLLFFNFPLAIIQTMFFLKLTVSGHSLIFVAHTKERWWKFLPSKQVVMATVGTQILATTLALTGWLMPSSISWKEALFVWVWALLWMQVSELMKDLHKKILKIK